MDIFFLNLIVHKQNRYQFMSLCIYGISGSRFNESGILKLENYSDQFSPVHEQFVQTRTVNRFNRLIKKKEKKKDPNQKHDSFTNRSRLLVNVRLVECWLCKFISFAISDLTSVL